MNVVNRILQPLNIILQTSREYGFSHKKYEPSLLIIVEKDKVIFRLRLLYRTIDSYIVYKPTEFNTNCEDQVYTVVAKKFMSLLNTLQDFDTIEYDNSDNVIKIINSENNHWFTIQPTKITTKNEKDIKELENKDTVDITELTTFFQNSLKTVNKFMPEHNINIRIRGKKNDAIIIGTKYNNSYLLKISTEVDLLFEDELRFSPPSNKSLYQLFRDDVLRNYDCFIYYKQDQLRIEYLSDDIRAVTFIPLREISPTFDKCLKVFDRLSKPHTHITCKNGAALGRQITKTTMANPAKKVISECAVKMHNNSLELYNSVASVISKREQVHTTIDATCTFNNKDLLKAGSTFTVRQDLSTMLFDYKADIYLYDDNKDNESWPLLLTRQKTKSIVIESISIYDYIG